MLEETRVHNCRLLSWDTDFWGYPVGKLDCSHLRDGMEPAIMDWCREHGIRCLYFLADGSDAETLHCAYKAGFQFVDARIDLELSPDEKNLTNAKRVLCRLVEPQDLEILESMARHAHTDARFFKDNRFNRQKAEELYSRWITRDYHENQIFVAASLEKPELALGYLTIEKKLLLESRIGLMAVTPSARGRGVGGELLNYSMRQMKERGVRCVRVATQGSNISALRMYTGAGFDIIESKVWFHRWFN